MQQRLGALTMGSFPPGARSPVEQTGDFWECGESYSGSAPHGFRHGDGVGKAASESIPSPAASFILFEFMTVLP